MALVKCPDCAKEISDKAAACIGCGCPVNQAYSTPLTTAPDSPIKKENTVAVALKILAAIALIIGFLLTIMEIHNTPAFHTPNLAVAIGHSIVGLIVAVILFVFGEIISLLHRNSKK